MQVRGQGLVQLTAIETETRRYPPGAGRGQSEVCRFRFRLSGTESGAPSLRIAEAPFTDRRSTPKSLAASRWDTDLKVDGAAISSTLFLNLLVPCTRLAIAAAAIAAWAGVSWRRVMLPRNRNSPSATDCLPLPMLKLS